MSQSTIREGVLRRLMPAELGGFRDHLLRLDAPSRQSRFGMEASDAFVIAYAERCFGIDDVIYGFVADGMVRAAGELRGIGHNLPLGLGASAEAAFSVEIAWRRRGIGERLMGRIVRAARNRRAQALYMSCLANNEPMLRLVRKFSAQLRFEPDVADDKVAPRSPTPGTFLGEAADDAAGFATAMMDLHRRSFELR